MRRGRTRCTVRARRLPRPGCERLGVDQRAPHARQHPLVGVAVGLHQHLAHAERRELRRRGTRGAGCSARPSRWRSSGGSVPRRTRSIGPGPTRASICDRSTARAAARRSTSFIRSLSVASAASRSSCVTPPASCVDQATRASPPAELHVRVVVAPLGEAAEAHDEPERRGEVGERVAPGDRARSPARSQPGCAASQASTVAGVQFRGASPCRASISAPPAGVPRADCYAFAMALLACPFCRELFQEGERRLARCAAWPWSPSRSSAVAATPSRGRPPRRAGAGAPAGHLPGPRPRPAGRRSGSPGSSRSSCRGSTSRCPTSSPLRVRARAAARLGVGRGRGLVRPGAHGAQPAEHHADARRPRRRAFLARRPRDDGGRAPRASAARRARRARCISRSGRRSTRRSASRSSRWAPRCCSAAARTTSALRRGSSAGQLVH